MVPLDGADLLLDTLLDEDLARATIEEVIRAATAAVTEYNMEEVREKAVTPMLYIQVRPAKVPREG